MNTDRLESIDHTVQLTHIWINELDEMLGWSDKSRSYRLLRTVLQTLRDWLPVNRSADLAAQLPALFRGVYMSIGGRPPRLSGSARRRIFWRASITRSSATRSSTLPKPCLSSFSSSRARSPPVKLLTCAMHCRQTYVRSGPCLPKPHEVQS